MFLSIWDAGTNFPQGDNNTVIFGEILKLGLKFIGADKFYCCTVKSVGVVFLPFDKTSRLMVSGSGTGPVLWPVHAAS